MASIPPPAIIPNDDHFQDNLDALEDLLNMIHDLLRESLRSLLHFGTAQSSARKAQLYGSVLAVLTGLFVGRIPGVTNELLKAYTMWIARMGDNTVAADDPVLTVPLGIPASDMSLLPDFGENVVPFLSHLTGMSILAAPVYDHLYSPWAVVPPYLTHAELVAMAPSLPKTWGVWVGSWNTVTIAFRTRRIKARITRRLVGPGVTMVVFHRRARDDCLTRFAGSGLGSETQNSVGSGGGSGRPIVPHAQTPSARWAITAAGAKTLGRPTSLVALRPLTQDQLISFKFNGWGTGSPFLDHSRDRYLLPPYQLELSLQSRSHTFALNIKDLARWNLTSPGVSCVAVAQSLASPAALPAVLQILINGSPIMLTRKNPVVQVGALFRNNSNQIIVRRLTSTQHDIYVIAFVYTPRLSPTDVAARTLAAILAAIPPSGSALPAAAAADDPAAASVPLGPLTMTLGTQSFTVPRPAVLTARSAMMDAVFGASDLAVLSASMSFLCPLAFARMTLPARGRTCRHLTSFFDLTTFLTVLSHQGKPASPCPICKTRLAPSDIHIDFFALAILLAPAFTHEDCEGVVILPDGRVVSDGAPSSEPPQPELKPQFASLAAASTSATAASAAAATSTSTSTSTTAAVSSPKPAAGADASAVNPDGFLARRKRKATNNIDLTTLDSDDDEDNATATATARANAEHGPGAGPGAGIGSTLKRQRLLCPPTRGPSATAEVIIID